MNTPKGIHLIYLLEQFVWGLIPVAVMVALVFARKQMPAPGVVWSVSRPF